MKLFILSAIILTSCANVKQIDRGRLASKIMQPSTNAEEKLFLNEVRSFREASVGGTVGAVGGGCGCN